MAKGKLVRVVKESSSGRNLVFQDLATGRKMPRQEFVTRIKSGEYDGYHVRKVGGVATPASNPDGGTRNNLG